MRNRYGNNIAHLRIYVIITLCNIARQRNVIIMTTKNETIKSLLNDFNATRVANNDDEIVKWSKSKQQLRDAIVEYANVNDVDNTMSVAQLSRELNINPKIARAKLRRRGIFATNGHHVRFERDDETYNAYVAIITTTRATNVVDES